MLKIYDLGGLSQQDIELMCRRNADENKTVQKVVEDIVSDVKKRGDEAINELSERFDGVRPDRLFIEREELSALADSVTDSERAAIQIAYDNIRKFHSGQLAPEEKVETSPGVVCWREPRAIDRVGLYVPGGSAVLPSTLLMLGIPARLAGCREIVVCSPPQKTGSINGYIAYCAVLLGIDRIYTVGGAQAVAAMAYGTESIPKVDKIFGPGNQYVTAAKTLVQQASQTAIDMPAGPSEVLIIADETANPAYVAADLLAQAEHGADSQAILLSNSISLIEETNRELELQLKNLPRRTIAEKAIANSYAIHTPDISSAVEFSNTYAPEHLIIETEDWESICPLIRNAGSVFLGHLTPESAGDYASGTNHTLPTSAYAKAYSGVSVDSFIKKITFQHINREGIEKLGPSVETLASIEGLDAHRNAITVRLKNKR